LTRHLIGLFNAIKTIRKFIKILCRVEGIEYKETKEVLERQIRITDVALVAKEILKIDIKLDGNV
jgi:hypothetical protein